LALGSESGQERTEQPTARRRDEARRHGQVARSTDVTSAAVLLGALGAFAMGGERFLRDAVDVIARGLDRAPRGDLRPDQAIAMLIDAGVAVARMAWPFLVVPAVIVIAGHLMQTRFAFAHDALSPQWNRLDPLAGLARLFGRRGLFEAVKAFAKLAAMGGVGYAALSADWTRLLALGQGGPASIVATVAHVVLNLWLAVGAAYLVIGALDYGYQWWEHERSLRMTKDELREEAKSTEGNPLVRSRLRALHRQMATKRMMVEVKRADVVLRNPTHYAVALKYDQTKMAAPRVVGKGARLLALQIIKIARQHGVPVVENPPLARTLYQSVPIGRDIPRDLYRAVAEVLAYVYSLKGRR
jgi:flagellar biosynthetic protein FlhB